MCRVAHDAQDGVMQVLQASVDACRWVVCALSRLMGWTMSVVSFGRHSKNVTGHTARGPIANCLMQGQTEQICCIVYATAHHVHGTWDLILSGCYVTTGLQAI